MIKRKHNKSNGTNIYTCNLCEYSTHDKSNYNKHTKSDKHNEIETASNMQKNRKSKPKKKLTPKIKDYICKYCDKKLAHQSSLSRHQHDRCKGKNNMNNLKEQLCQIQRLIESI